MPDSPDNLMVVRPGVPEQDGCPVLTRLQATLVPEGVRATIEHVFRDRQGNPLDLSMSASAESPESPGDDQQVLLRIKEFVGLHTSGSRIHLVEGEAYDAQEGVVRARLPAEVVERSGLYQMSWALVRGEVVAVSNGLLSVERSLFGALDRPDSAIQGPPTIQELRMQLWDSSASENTLLDDVEFDDEQIVLALQKPVNYFNEIPPPLGRRYTTANFPYREHWTEAVIGHLLEFAAHHYRRNRAHTQAGGVSLDDKNKEQEYLRAAQRHLEQWRDFAQRKKIELNAAQAYGSFGSSYSNW